jgi:hypothetical protein
MEPQYSLGNREDKELIGKHGKQKAFLTGGNSSCCHHVCTHFDIYKQKCTAAGLTVHHHTIPRSVWTRILAEKEGRKPKVQQTLDASLKTKERPQEFTREGILHAIAQFVVCDNQVCRIGLCMRWGKILTVLKTVSCSRK